MSWTARSRVFSILQAGHKRNKRTQISQLSSPPFRWVSKSLEKHCISTCGLCCRAQRWQCRQARRWVSTITTRTWTSISILQAASSRDSLRRSGRTRDRLFDTVGKAIHFRNAYCWAVRQPITVLSRNSTSSAAITLHRSAVSRLSRLGELLTIANTRVEDRCICCIGRKRVWSSHTTQDLQQKPSRPRPSSTNMWQTAEQETYCTHLLVSHVSNVLAIQETAMLIEVLLGNTQVEVL